MGVNLTDVLLFGKAQSDDVDNATLVIYRRNILRWSTIGGYLDIIVKGVAPLSLPDAIANSLSYVKAFGGTEQNGTPTPDAPMDIVCNNGVLKVSPNLFDQSLFNTSVGALITYVTYNIPNGTYTMSTNFPLVNTATNVFIIAGEVTTGASSSNNGVSSVSPRTITVTDGKYTIAYRSTSSINTNNPENFNFQLEHGSVATNYIPYGSVYADGTQETISVIGKNLYNPATRTDGYYINSNGVITSNAASSYSDLIPAYPNTNYVLSATKPISGDAGKRIHAYDANGDWLSMVAIASPSSIGPYTITGPTPAGCAYIRISIAETDVDVQVEKGSTATDYQPYHCDTATCEDLLSIGNYTDEQEVISGGVTRKVGVKVLDGTESWSRTDATSGVPFATFNLTLSTTAAGGLSNVPRCSHFVSATSTGRSNVPDNGVGVTTNPTYTIMWFRCDSITTTNDFTTWLATQYANGTPVIVVYPMVTPTTETVTGQPMQTVAGDNTAEITQASLDGLELEAKYKAAVSLTIQEVQDANLDPNVQVTIQ